MRAAPLFLIVAAAALLAGCSGGPNGSPTDGSSKPQVAGIVVAFLSARSPWEEVQYSVRVTDPSGRVQNGTMGTSFYTYVEGIPTNEWGDETTGDIRERDPEGYSTYPFMLFNETTYNGTWVIEIERTRDESAFAVAGQDPFDPKACMTILVSKPDGVMTFANPEVHVGTPDTDGISHGTIRVHYPTATYEVRRFPDDDVREGCRQ